ncbi:MAG: hypothetical protein IJ667_03645 [Synergistaceae bacterium]|nr:hypothetical protein [Synergistaceae bacterium]
MLINSPRAAKRAAMPPFAGLDSRDMAALTAFIFYALLEDWHVNLI